MDRSAGLKEESDVPSALSDHEPRVVPSGFMACEVDTGEVISRRYVHLADLARLKALEGERLADYVRGGLIERAEPRTAQVDGRDTEFLGESLGVQGVPFVRWAIVEAQSDVDSRFQLVAGASDKEDHAEANVTQVARSDGRSSREGHRVVPLCSIPDHASDNGTDGSKLAPWGAGRNRQSSGLQHVQLGATCDLPTAGAARQRVLPPGRELLQRRHRDRTTRRPEDRHPGVERQRTDVADGGQVQRVGISLLGRDDDLDSPDVAAGRGSLLGTPTSIRRLPDAPPADAPRALNGPSQNPDWAPTGPLRRDW